MNDIQLAVDRSGHGAFTIEENGARLAEMQVAISEKNITVYHTEVSEKLRGKGIAAQLLAAMVAYAREHQLQVIALCPYVSAQFKKHPGLYQDIWNQRWH